LKGRTVRKRHFSSVSKPRISFASDNTSGIHEKVLDAINRANVGSVTGYGEDKFTMKATEVFKGVFGEETSVYYVANGTAANVLGFGTVSTWYSSVLVSEVAHVNVDEGGSPERIFGLKTIPLRSEDGKIRPEQVIKHTHRKGDVHHSQPRVVSITQPTEFGVVYSKEEILSISSVCKQHGLLLHMDGARISNACASLGIGLKEGTKDLGLDFMSFGGTKNGIMLGEAVLFFNPNIDSTPFRHIQKQSMQMISKNRFIAVQMQALLEDELWLSNASHANNMASLLASLLSSFPKISFTHPTQANAIFATMPREYINYMLEDFYFYVWEETSNQVRLMASFNTQPQHIHAFISRLKEAQRLFG
jgi:threonine aldolase